MPTSPLMESFLQDRSKSGNNDLCINLYGEHVDGPKGPEIGCLFDRGGLVLLTTLGSGPIRGEFVANNGLMYVVSGNGFYSVTTSYVGTLIGTITTTTGPVQMVESPTQILLVDGAGGWCWNFITKKFNQVIPNASTSDVGPSTVCYQDGFAIVNSANSNIIYQSNYNDLSNFATLIGGGLGSTANDAYVQANPQNVVSVFDIKEEVWVFKQKSVEVWINQGTSGFAFAPLQGVSITVGCCAPYSVARLGDSVVWLGSDDQGDGLVYMSQGYSAKPITTFALASLFVNFPIISDAIAYSFQRNGHYFYVLTFPSAGATYVYDLVTGKWHQRAYFSNGSFGRELPNCHTLFTSQNVVGDYSNGNIYMMSDTVLTDNGQPRKWLRCWDAMPYSVPSNIPMTYSSLQLFMETGITDPPTDMNPQIMLRWSDDGGYTWTGYFQMAAGQLGNTSWRVMQNRLGSTKIGTGLQRVWEISGTDPISIKLTSAEYEGGPS